MSKLTYPPGPAVLVSTGSRVRPGAGAIEARLAFRVRPLGLHHRRNRPVDLDARSRRHRRGLGVGRVTGAAGERRASLVLGFLAVTYLVWAAGLRVNVQANWRLLEDTGTSTNAVSKGLFDLVRHRSCSRRALRTASAAGYVGPEIVKEAPYYAGAFGAALLSDAVDATDALIFLGGTNIGAAVYEYTVGRLTRSYLNGRSRRIARVS